MLCGLYAGSTFVKYYTLTSTDNKLEKKCEARIGTSNPNPSSKVIKEADIESLSKLFEESFIMSDKEGPGVPGPGVPPGDEPSKADQLMISICEVMVTRKGTFEYVKRFAETTVISRRVVNATGKAIEEFNKLLEYDKQLAEDYTEWLVVCGKSDEELNLENHEWCPQKIDPLFEEFDRVKVASEANFKQILTDYNDHLVVQDCYRNFKIGKASSAQPGWNVPFLLETVPSGSVASGKGDEYVKRKVPEIVKELELKLQNLIAEVEKEP